MKNTITSMGRPGKFQILAGDLAWEAERLVASVFSPGFTQFSHLFDARRVLYFGFLQSIIDTRRHFETFVPL